MRRIAALLLPCAVAVLALAGCSSTPPPTAAPVARQATQQPAVETTAAQATPTPTTTADGWLRKAIGQEAELLLPDNTTVTIKFKVTKIGGCYGGGYYGDRLAHGLKRIVVHETMQYTSAYDATEAAPVDPWSMQAITSDGRTVTDIVPDSTWQCVPQPDDLAMVSGLYQADHTYVGAMELDVPVNTVRLELPINGDPGWYWDMPK